jgi:hypothetical protein
VVSRGSWLGSYVEEHGNESAFCYNIALCYPSHSPLANHVHRFDAFESSPGALKRAVALNPSSPFLNRSMVLFDHIVEILALTQTNPAWKCAGGFQGVHCGRISCVLSTLITRGNGIRR